MPEFLLWVQVLFSPRYWVQAYPTDMAWDNAVRRLLETESFEKISDRKATLGPYRVWISHHPYASFSPENMNVLPTRRTRLLAHKKLIQEFLRRKA